MSVDLPFVSVIVPTHDRPTQLRACLGSLVGQDYPNARFELIVVDDGSAISPAPVVASFANGVRLQLVSQRNSGPAAARNAGARRAAGHILAFTDDDCCPEPNWLSVLVDRLGAASDRMVGGRTANALFENPYSEASQELVAFLYEYYNRDPERGRFLASNNLAVPSAAFQEAGGFDERFRGAAGEDRELCARWLRRGGRILYEPRAIVRHSHALSLRSFWRQHRGYGYGALQLRQLLIEQGRSPLPLEPLAFYFGLVRCGFRAPTVRQRWFRAGLLFLSQLANAAGYASARVQEGIRRARAVPDSPMPMQ